MDPHDLDASNTLRRIGGSEVERLSIVLATLRQMERVDVAIVGGGQAGLALSHQLTEARLEHVVLERGRIGQAWRDRWDTFCLVTPNWSVALPGGAYEGDDPDGFLLRDEIVAHLERYADSFRAPIRHGVDVATVRIDRDGFVLDTSQGDLSARVVALATGAYQRPHRPPGIDDLPMNVELVDATEYRNEAKVPPGRVLIIGSGQTGCQLAEELHEAGRDVFLACGRTPWAPRRMGGRDIFWWALETGFMRQRVEALSDPAMRLVATVVTTGHDGGHDLHLRTLDAMGVTLTGHFSGVRNDVAQFADDLPEAMAWSDERASMLIDLIRETATQRNLPVPDYHRCHR
jgi:cation diffusion facilitator CzcD-associated flavoprotein CzcO